jgi:hypothetical protein
VSRRPWHTPTDWTLWRQHALEQLTERRRLDRELIHDPQSIERVDRLAAAFRTEMQQRPDRFAPGYRPLVGELSQAEAQARLASCQPIAAEDPAAASLRRLVKVSSAEPEAPEPEAEPPEKQWLTDEPEP